HGPASTTRSRGSSGSAWNESAERNGASCCWSWAKWISRASRSAPTTDTTVLVVPKSIPMAASLPDSAMTRSSNAEKAGAGKEGVGLAGCVEVAPDQPAVDGSQLFDLGDRRALVDRVHGGAHQAKLDDRAERANEAGVGGAAGGGKLRPAAGHLLDHASDQLDEPSGLGEERLAADEDLRLDLAVEALASLRRLRLDPLGERRAGVGRVEADVEPRPRGGGDHVGRRIADVDGGDLEVRGLELRIALVEH